MILRPFRNEVLEFATVAERILGAASLTHELTEDLRGDRQSWSTFIHGTRNQGPAYSFDALRVSKASC